MPPVWYALNGADPVKRAGPTLGATWGTDPREGFGAVSLGMPEQIAFATDGDDRVAILHAGIATIELATRSHARNIDEFEGMPATPPGPPSLRIALEVEDTELAVARTIDAGVNLLAPPTTRASRLHDRRHTRSVDHPPNQSGFQCPMGDQLPNPWSAPNWPNRLHPTSCAVRSGIDVRHRQRPNLPVVRLDSIDRVGAPHPGWDPPRPSPL